MDPNAQQQAGASSGQEDYLDKGKWVIQNHPYET